MMGTVCVLIGLVLLILDARDFADGERNWKLSVFCFSSCRFT